MNKQDIIDYVLKTPSNTNPAVLDTMLNELSGGSGSSDFTTAELTLDISENNNSQIVVPVVYSQSPSIIATIITNTGPSPAHDTIIVPLYKGRLVLTGTIDGIVSVSGDCEYQQGSFLITGDCTITIS